MATPLQGTDENGSRVATPAERVYADTLEGRRARRIEALKLIAGIWQDRADIPADGVEYQRQLRHE